jgi:hypothetical protein
MAAGWLCPHASTSIHALEQADISCRPSLCRRRPDRSLLAAGQMTGAGSEKHRLEEMQRAERREREKRSGSWTPRWFKQIEAPQLFPGGWVHNSVSRWGVRARPSRVHGGTQPGMYLAGSELQKVAQEAGVGPAGVHFDQHHLPDSCHAHSVCASGMLGRPCG